MEDAWESAALFKGADPGAVESLIEDMERFYVPKGQVIKAEGEPGDSMYIVMSGKVVLSRRSADGRQNLIAVLGPSDMFGEGKPFDPGPWGATATAWTDARVARLPRAVLRPWLADRPDAAEEVLRSIARRMRRTSQSMADLVFTDVPGRVAKALLHMASRLGTRDGGALRVTCDLTQEELAQLVGASREAVNKAMADFAGRGWVRLEDGSLIIMDAERLARRAR
jgi:CRP-like cAMP-binding protein